VEEGRKRVLLIAVSILAARKLAQISKMNIFPSYGLGCYTALVCSFLMNRSRDIQPSHDGEQCGSLQS